MIRWQEPAESPGSVTDADVGNYLKMNQSLRLPFPFKVTAPQLQIGMCWPPHLLCISHQKALGVCCKLFRWLQGDCGQSLPYMYGCWDIVGILLIACRYSWVTCFPLELDLTFLQYSMDKWIMIECQRYSMDLSHKWGLLWILVMRITLVRGLNLTTRQICWEHISFLILFILYAICIWKTGSHFSISLKEDERTSSISRIGLLFDKIKWIHFIRLSHFQFFSLSRETTSSSAARLLTLAVLTRL